MENFGGDLKLKRLDLTWSGQVDSVDLTAATLRSSLWSEVSQRFPGAETDEGFGVKSIEAR